MLNFFDKSLLSSRVMYGMVDCHSHLLPGVDDGVKSEDQASQVLTYFETLGVRRIVLTPHIMDDYPLNTADFLREKFRELCKIYRGSIDLSLGAEYMLDGGFEHRLEADTLLTISDKQLLVETSYLQAPVNFHQLIQKIHSKGYHLTLAHPERYAYMRSSDYKQLKQSNVKFQLNLLSLVGAYGSQVQAKSRKLLQADFYDCMGSDLHHLATFERWAQEKQLSSKVIRRLKALKCHSED